jgi:hypothetical protein
MFGWDKEREYHELVLLRLTKVIVLLSQLVEQLVPKPVDSFVITRWNKGDLMNINPGQSTTLTATPLAAPVPPATVGLPTVLPTGDVPTWTLNAPTSVTATPSKDGLSLVVAVLPTAPAGDINFIITDGLIPTATGSFTLTVTAPTQAPVASFSVSASTPV